MRLTQEWNKLFMEILIILIFGFCAYLLYKKNSTNADVDSSNNVEGLLKKRFLQIIDESIEIIQNTKNLDVVLSRYETLRSHICDRPKNDVLVIENLDDSMEQVREITAIGIKNCCIDSYNEKLDKAMNLKTDKGKANNLILLVKYYEDNLNEIPNELNEYCESEIRSCQSKIEGIKVENSSFTKILIDAGVEIPNWWKKDWKDH